MAYGYLIVVHDNASNNYSYGVPEDVDASQVIFTSYESAKIAIKEASKKFAHFIPVAYGNAYPYDSTTFDNEINTKSFAPYGWGVISSEEESAYICIGLLRMTLD